ncbi:chromate transporter [Paenibacillus sp. F411]|uniref:Chromate transporter n=1 Tax=Paenibacillus algicola TaxID=2565926 RepID=A0A4P8XNY3_9BACL|nr:MULTISPECIES: chromate transporter [Paenibacillus]MBO2943399.1 chromate transporter [Paenibacillus sp. F411]QCT02029.1 Chromate transporter [Paenibacillus algicola]
MSNERRRLIIDLFKAFFQIGPSTFGGGYAMLPVIEREIMVKRGWMDEKEMADMISLSGSAPGGVGVNAAAFIGYRKAGVPGAAAAVIGITLPTFLIVILLSVFYLMFHDHEKTQAALQGIQGAVIALILLAAYRMAKQSVFDISTAVMMASAVIILVVFPISPIYMIGFGILAGIVFIQIKRWIGLSIQTEKEIVVNATPQSYSPEYYI